MADKKEGTIPDFLNRTGVEFRKSEGGHLDFEYVELRRFSKWGFSVYCQIHYASPGGQALTIIATPMQEFDSGLRTQILELANQKNSLSRFGHTEVEHAEKQQDGREIFMISVTNNNITSDIPSDEVIRALIDNIFHVVDDLYQDIVMSGMLPLHEIRKQSD